MLQQIGKRNENGVHMISSVIIRKAQKYCIGMYDFNLLDSPLIYGEVLSLALNPLHFTPSLLLFLLKVVIIDCIIDCNRIPNASLFVFVCYFSSPNVQHYIDIYFVIENLYSL